MLITTKAFIFAFIIIECIIIVEQATIIIS